MQYSHLMDPGCHRPASASPGPPEVDDNACLSRGVRGQKGTCRAGDRGEGLSLARSMIYDSLGAVLPDLNPPQHKHPRRSIDKTLLYKKQRNEANFHPVTPGGDHAR